MFVAEIDRQFARLQKMASRMEHYEGECEDVRRVKYQEGSRILNEMFERQVNTLERFIIACAMTREEWVRRFFPPMFRFVSFSHLLDLQDGIYPFVIAVPREFLSLGTQVSLLQHYYRLPPQGENAFLDWVDAGRRGRVIPYLVRRIRFCEFPSGMPLWKARNAVLGQGLSPLRLHEVLSVMLFEFRKERFRSQYVKRPIAVLGSRRGRDVPVIGGNTAQRWPIRFVSPNTAYFEKAGGNGYAVLCGTDRVQQSKQ